MCCCRYKGDNAEQCEATMTSGMGSLCTMREPHFFLSSFFTTLISAFKESEEVSKFRGTRNKRLQRAQRFQGVTLPGVENMIPCLARAHTILSLFPPFKAICIPAPPPPPWPCAPLLLSAPPNSRQRFFLLASFSLRSLKK